MDPTQVRIKNTRTRTQNVEKMQKKRGNAEKNAGKTRKRRCEVRTCYSPFPHSHDAVGGLHVSNWVGYITRLCISGNAGWSGTGYGHMFCFTLAKQILRFLPARNFGVLRLTTIDFAPSRKTVKAPRSPVAKGNLGYDACFCRGTRQRKQK